MQLPPRRLLGLSLSDRNIVTATSPAAAKDGVRVGDRTYSPSTAS